MDWFSPIKSLMPGGASISGITDWLGITDTQAQQRGLDALNSGAAGANANLDASMQPVFGMYQDAMQGRNMGDVLDTYRQQMSGTANAADQNNVANFMNPMYGRAVSNATNQALAGAGSSALSTAGNNAVASGVADTTQSMWQDAFRNAMTDAQNKQGVYGSIAQSDLSPSNSWAQLTSDLAGAKYDAQTAQANAAAQVAGQNRGWFSSLFNGVLG